MVSDEADVVVVIGSGMGGLAAARTIAQFGGKRVLVLEQHYTLGGDDARVLPRRALPLRHRAALHERERRPVPRV
ncbi:NAD(P)-binding protein, partial [Streptomyces sp. NPDC005827]|uniref:NAD(P)-binding protein n=1 Tax=Streptomyces sp. NPDC005827 TaxID=3157070 RepID=UPI0033CF66D7